MAFPPAHLLVGAGAAEVTCALLPLPRWRAWALAATLAVLPDADFGLGLVAGRAGAYHGTFTHSLLAVTVVGMFAAVAAGWRWGVLGAVGYGSHLLVDLLDDRGRTNVLLGWPFTLEQPLAIARVFPTVPFEQGEGVGVAFRSLFEPPVMRALLQQTAVGVACFAALLALATLARTATRRPLPR